MHIKCVFVELVLDCTFVAADILGYILASGGLGASSESRQEHRLDVASSRDKPPESSAACRSSGRNAIALSKKAG